MKLLLVLTAIIAAATSGPVIEGQKGPWQVGKVYHYDVYSHTFTNFQEGLSHGSAFKAQFIITVKSPGHLIAKFQESSYTPFKAHILDKFNIPDVKYQPFKDIDQTFEIFVDGGRVVSINVSTTLSASNTNFLKGLISALQVDLSPLDLVDNYPNSFDKNTFQGLFKKMETDITGQCETLYSVLPMASEWRRELPNFTSEEDLVEITKSKNYGNCQKSVVYYEGVPKSKMLHSTHNKDEKQIVKHTFQARILAGKQGPIYKVEAVSSAISNHVVRALQEAEVFSYVKFYLNSVEKDTDDSSQKPGEYHLIKSLLYNYDNTSIYTRGDPQAVSKAQGVLQSLAPLLQNPNNISKGKFLLHFQILVDILASFNSEQLTLLTNSIEIARTSKNIAKTAMWTMYRDAIALTGTPEAYEQIKAWILSKKIEGEEAAEVISTLGVSFINPSIDLLKDFFKFSTSSPVTELKLVNNAAVLASSRSWVRFLEEDKFIEEAMVPYFAKKLKQAVENSDSNNAQVYIKALGNLADPSIIKVFAPYLEGHITVSKYIRIQMVTNLKDLAYLKNEYVRAVLYSMVRNPSEVYEVRVAAVLNLFLAFPTAEMMQVLARMTQYDLSTHVRAVLTKSITVAAGLKDPRYAELTKNAQSVMHMVTKEKFGSIYSDVEVEDGYTGQEDDTHFFSLSSIGSKNNFFPKYLRSAFRYKGYDFTDNSEVTLALSDVQDFINSFMDVFSEPTEVDHKFKFTAKQIVERLKIKSKPRQPLEGALYIEDSNQQELITFNEKDLYMFISEASKSIANLLKGTDAQYSKVTLSKNIVVSFPLASGLPFLFKYTEPSIITAQTHAAVVIDKKTLFTIGSLKTKFDFTYAYEVESAVSFTDIFGDVYNVAGISSGLQFQIPLKINTEFNPGYVKVQLEPLYTDKDINLIHIEVVPFTGVFKSKTLIYDLEPIRGSAKTVETDYKVGQLMGMVYQLQGYSYSSDYKDWEKEFDDDFNTRVGSYLYQRDVALTDFTLKYLAKETTVKSTTFTLNLDTLFIQKNSGEMGPATTTKHVAANSEARREEMIKKVSSGIDSATVQLLDFSVKFDGLRATEFVLTGAMAYSVVDPKFQAAFFAHAYDEQVNAVFKSNTGKAKLTSLNFEEVLKNELKLTYEGNFQYQNNNIILNGYGTRSKEYTELLKNDPMAKHCVQDISKRNFYQNDCYNMILKAYAPDYFTATVTYNDVDPTLFDIGGYAYKQYIKNKYSVDEKKNSVVKTIDNKMVIEAQAHFYDNYIDYKVVTKYGSINLDKMKVSSDFPYALSIYAPVDYFERFLDWIDDYEKKTYCAVDDNKVWTFSGRSYDYALTGSWHVVMVDANELGQDLAILARRPSANQEEIYISYKTQFGKFFELDIKPDNIEVKSNANKTSDGTLTMYWDDDEETPLLEYYTVGDGVYVFVIHGTRLHLIYDKHRLVIFTEDYYSSTWGICGQSSTEVRDDYLTPWGLVDLPEYYGASFSLDGEFSDPKTTALKKEAKLRSYQPENKFTNILSFDSEWSKIKNFSEQQPIVKNLRSMKKLKNF